VVSVASTHALSGELPEVEELVAATPGHGMSA
jgi:hypothetical protein